MGDDLALSVLMLLSLGGGETILSNLCPVGCMVICTPPSPFQTTTHISSVDHIICSSGYLVYIK